MEKGTKSRRKILGVAFKLFATYSFPDVSYSLLEEATGISRGSMVYYFKNKEGIFRAVLDTFFYGPTAVEVDPEARKSLRKFFTAYVEQIRENIALLKPYHIPNRSAARFNIERSAAQFIPGFSERAAALQREEGKVWREVVANSVESGELKTTTDIDAVGKLFQALTMGFFYMSSQIQPPESVDALLALYESEYALIAG